MTGDQSMWTGDRSLRLPEKSVSLIPSGPATTISPSSRNRALRVYESRGGRSEATKVSPSPIPTTIGQFSRAPTIVPSSFSEMARNAYEPTSSDTVFRAASVSDNPEETKSSSRCAITSVSVSEKNVRPREIRRSFSFRWFSIIPLWTTATVPVLCG